MCIFDSQEDAGEDGLLKGIIEHIIELFELFADEADCQDGYLLDYEVLTTHI
jgi:hypothetical protein